MPVAESAFLTLDGITRHFTPKRTLGDRIAARLGAGNAGTVHAVDGVSLTVNQGETLGLVGESGCGKSTLGRIVAGILKPTSGKVLLEGTPLLDYGKGNLTRIQTVFQDPFASLNPRMRIGDTISEGPIVHRLIRRQEARSYVGDWLERVGLERGYAERYPHQFSGGQRQRVAIARALAMQPDILICDEPVASLDVSIQAQIINLFLRLRRELTITCLFISHDLGIVRHVSDRVAIMYLGQIVEVAARTAVYSNPQHPYTRALLDSVPRLVQSDHARVEFKVIRGELPSALTPPSGCRFHPRCPLATARCRDEAPELRRLALDDGHYAACHLV